MEWFVLIGGLIILLFGFVVFFGPPYLPTPSRQVELALDMLDLAPGQTLLEIGCGDGRVLKAAAQRGWLAVGIELNPILLVISRIRTWRYRRQVKIIWGDFWHTQWPPADAVFTFLIQRQMKKLDERIRDWAKKPVRLATFAFQIPGRKPIKKRNAMILYEYK